jgi:hypothetical protein
MFRTIADSVLCGVLTLELARHFGHHIRVAAAASHHGQIRLNLLADYSIKINSLAEFARQIQVGIAFLQYCTFG